MAVEALIAWLAGSVVAPDAFTRTVNSIRSEGAEYRRLIKAVRETSGIRPRRAYQQWFFRDSTWGSLVTTPEETHGELVDSLDAELRRRWHVLSRRPSSAERRKQAERLVDATIWALIPSLEPSRAVAVAEHRIRSDVKGVASDVKDVRLVLETSNNLQTLLEQIPPPARDPINQLFNCDAGLAAQVLQVVTGSEHPPDAVAALVSDPPDWLHQAPADAWLFLAEIITAHGIWDVASTLWEKLANLGVERARNLARAALASATGDDSQRAHELIEKAQQVGGHAQTVGIIAAALDNHAERIVSLSREADQVDIAVVAIAAEALTHTEDIHSAIAAYRRAIDLHPLFAGLHLRLAQLLQQASHQPASGSVGATQREARTAALKARDLRRQWRGPSAEAVIVVCDLALARQDWDDVLRLGRPIPDGEATPEEAATLAVQRAVVEAALASDQPEVATQVLAQISEPFAKHTLQAQYLLATAGNTAEAARLLHDAWPLAADDVDRMVVGTGLAALGEDLPDRDVLESRDDVQAALVLAQSERAAGDTEAAITRLRAWRNKSRHVIGILAGLYASRDDIDAAVDTFAVAAVRFDDPTFLALAAQMVANQGNLARAEELAVRALTAISDEPRVRLMLHEILIAAAQDRGAWRDMEARVRAVIDEHGETPHLRWLLIGSLFNQRRLGEAWTALQSHPALTPDTEQRARVWVHLHTSFRSAPELADQLLWVVDQFPDSPDLIAAIIGHFLTSPIHESASEESQVRWRTRIARFVEEHPAHPAFFSISLPDDPDELIAALRPYLEPGTQDFEDLCRQVAEARIPYGMLAAYICKPYAAALVHRAASCLPIYSADDQVALREASDARKALHKSIVVDTSTLAVTHFVASLWPRILGSFQRMVIPGPAHADLVQASEGFRLRSDGTLGWDTRAQRPSATEPNAEVQQRLREHAQWMVNAAGDLDVVDWSRLCSLPRRDEIGDNDRFLSWLAPLDYAVTYRLPFFADDVVLRTLARAEGIPTFGTVQILQAFADSGTIDDGELNANLDTLRREYCVDLPLDADSLIRVARLDQWEPRAVAFTFSRPTTWRTGEHAFRVWRLLCNQVAIYKPEYLASWLYAAITGVAYSKQAHQVTALAATMLFSATLASDVPPTRFPKLLKAARDATTQLAGNDLLPTTVTIMLEVFTPQSGPEFGARAVLWLAAELDEQDRSVVREIVFRPNQA
jgi:tetratricopeptide (TPR) repeat protein